MKIGVPTRRDIDMGNKKSENRFDTVLFNAELFGCGQHTQQFGKLQPCDSTRTLILSAENIDAEQEPCKLEFTLLSACDGDIELARNKLYTEGSELGEEIAKNFPLDLEMTCRPMAILRWFDLSETMRDACRYLLEYFDEVVRKLLGIDVGTVIVWAGATDEGCEMLTKSELIALGYRKVPESKTAFYRTF